MRYINTTNFQQFILIKTLKENYDFIIEILKQVLGNAIEALVEDEYLLIRYSSVDLSDLTATIRSLEGDLNTLISYYHSSTKKQNKEFELILNLFLNASYGYYDFKSLLLNAKTIDNASEILHFILDNTGVDEKIILEIANNDLNVSKAASKLYLHRNTLLYKMEHLNELSDFDLKSFNDLYILIRLLKA